MLKFGSDPDYNPDPYYGLILITGSPWSGCSALIGYNMRYKQCPSTFCCLHDDAYILLLLRHAEWIQPMRSDSHSLRRSGRRPVLWRRRTADLTWTRLRRLPSINSAVLKYSLIGLELDRDLDLSVTLGVVDVELFLSTFKWASVSCSARGASMRPMIDDIHHTDAGMF